MESIILDAQGNSVGTVAVSPALCEVQIKPHVLHQVVCAQESQYIKKTASSKGRAEVSGGGRKPWRQKGTGRARAGSSRSPLWKGGGVTFGPKPRVIKSRPPRSLRRLAFKMAWSDRFASDAVIIVRGFGLDEVKTKAFLTNIAACGAQGRVLVVISEADEVLKKSLRNVKVHRDNLYLGKIRGVSLRTSDQVTVHDILLSDRIVMTEEGLSKVTKRIESV